MESTKKKVFCDHCSTYLSKKTYKTHQRLYYDSTTETWIKKLCGTPDFDEWDDDDEFHPFEVSTEQHTVTPVDWADHGEVPPIVEFSGNIQDTMLDQPLEGIAMIVSYNYYYS